MIHNRFENEWPWGRSVTLIDEDGCAMVEVTKEDSNNYAYISGLKVHPSVQRNGRATELLHCAELQALGLGVNIVLLQVVPNTWVHDWYIRKGYSDFGKCDNGFVELVKVL